MDAKTTLEPAEEEALIQKFLSFRGSAKRKTTDEEYRRVREEVGKELLAEWELEKLEENGSRVAREHAKKFSILE